MADVSKIEVTGMDPQLWSRRAVVMDDNGSRAARRSSSAADFPVLLEDPVSRCRPMKKLVAYLMPVAEPTVAQPPSLPEFPTSQPESGAMKIEALLSDSDAERILTTIAGCQVTSREQQFVTQLVDQELSQAGPRADDLWVRIVAAVERRLICQVYADCDGVKTRAAARLGIDRNTLHKKLRQYDLIENGAADAEIVVEQSP